MVKRIIFGVGFFLLLLTSAPVKASPLCTCSQCPDLSQDLLRLTGFELGGHLPLKEGDVITLQFKLQNYGQSDIVFGSQGVFAVAKHSDTDAVFLGSMFQNQTIRPMEEIDFETSANLDKAGEWKFWPSYQIQVALGQKMGPDEWNLCLLEAEALPTSSPTLSPSPLPSPPASPIPSPSPALSLIPTLVSMPRLTLVPTLILAHPKAPDRFSFITDGPVMQEAVEDGDGDGVLNFQDECLDTPSRLKDHVFENGCVCQDTDDGLDFDRQGTITYRDRNGEEHVGQDYCSGDNVIEYYCDLDYEEGRSTSTDAGDFRLQRYCGYDYYCFNASCRLRPGVGVEAAICFAPEGSAMEGTCTDGIQNLNEEGVDCGGICSPCNTKCITETKYAPADTPCTAHYPTDPHRIDLPWTDNEIELACQLTEVCHPDLDYIIEEAAQCCSLMEEADIDGTVDPNLCREARNLSRADCDVLYPWSTCYGLCQKCTSLYIIKGLGSYARWMQGYTHLYRDGGACEDGDCYYSDGSAPAEMLVNDLKTGICRDYAQVLTTLLRKAGLPQSNVANFCDGRHCYNVVKLPGDSQWHVVDTTGNLADISLGGLPTDYPYCFALNEANWCFDGVMSTGESCEQGFVGEHAGYDYDFDADSLPGCQHGVACGRDLYSVPGWSPAIENIVGCD